MYFDAFGTDIINVNDKEDKVRLSTAFFVDSAFDDWINATEAAAEAGTLSTVEAYVRENYSNYGIAMLCDLTKIDG